MIPEEMLTELKSVLKSLPNVAKPDANGNVLITSETDGSQAIVVAPGVSDMIIVKTKTLSLVCPRDDTAALKAVILNIIRESTTL